MTPYHQIMFDQNHEHTFLIMQGKVSFTYLFTLINYGGVVAEIEIESLLRGRGGKGRRRNDRGQVQKKSTPHTVRFSCRANCSGN